MATENDNSPNSICWRLSPRSFFFWKKDAEIKVHPIIVDFQRLISCNITAVDGVSNRDLLHALIGLYDTCLPDITPEILYSTVCSKWTKTLVLIRDKEEVLQEMVTKYGKTTERNVPEDSLPSQLHNLALCSNSQTQCVPDQTDRTHDACSDQNSAHIQEEKDSNNSSNKITTSYKCAGHGKCSSEECAEEHNHDNATSMQDAQINSKNEGLDGDGNDVSDLKEVFNIDLDEKKKEKSDDDDEQKFDGVFSDTESEGSPESDEEGDDGEDLSAGVDEFIAAARKRHSQRLQGDVSMNTLGIESCIVGCTTFERSYSKPSEKILLLQLLSIRKRYRKCGLGKYLVNCVRDPTLVGLYDTIVVHADPEAVEFFKAQNFNDDVILNSRFSHVSDLWENSILMCYLPPFTGSDMSTGAFRGIAEIISMEAEMKKWKEKSIESYQAQMTCMVRLQHEIKTLRAMVENQDEMILTLKLENETTQCEKFTIEKEYLDYRLKNRIGLLMGLSIDDDDDDDEETQDDEEKLLSALISSQGKEQITTEFIQSMKKDKMYFDVQVQDVRKVDPEFKTVLQAKFDSRVKCLVERNMCLELYYCGGTGAQLERILQQGFSEDDVSEDLFGKGLYFSHHACKAAQFSVPGMVLVARVGLGKVESVVQKNPQRQSPPDGFDSILTPGRESYPPLSSTDSQEYVVFNYSQAMPLYLIEYTVTRV